MDDERSGGSVDAVPALTTIATLDAAVRHLFGPANLTPPDVAREAGVDLDLARRFWRALGFPPVPDDQRCFAAADVAMLRAATDLVVRGGNDTEVVLQMTRVIGQSLARVAEAQLTAVGVGRTVSDAAARIELGGDGSGGIDLLVTSVEPFLGYIWRRHLLAALARFTAAPGTGTQEGREIAVGFADMVGFTAISQQLEEHDLAAMVSRFEALAADRVAQAGGRLVKMIGDAVMFAADQITDAGLIALDLVECHAHDPALPDLRAGLAFGPTLSWEGDLFGPTVNLASRLVNIARPGTVLVDPTAAQRLADGPVFQLRPLRRVQLKGIGRVRASVLRRAGARAGASLR